MKSINRRRGDTKRRPLINNLYYYWLLLILLASALIWLANLLIDSNTTISNKKDGMISSPEDTIPHYHDYAVLFVMYHKTGW